MSVLSGVNAFTTKLRRANGSKPIAHFLAWFNKPAEALPSAIRASIAH
jgi:hypothetical protein